MLVPLLLLLVVVLYRVILGITGSSDLAWLHNFAPVAAIALCGAVYLPRRLAWALPLGMLLVSDLVLNLAHYDRPMLTWEIVPRYAALALIVALGLALRAKARPLTLMAGSVVGSLIFYAVTNTGSWLGQPAYAKNLAGWVQALTVGEAGFPSTFWFYRQTLISDLVFTALFIGCMALRSRATAPAELKGGAVLNGNRAEVV